MSYSSVITGDSPAAWWRFNDTNATLADSSGNSHPGSYVGTAGTDYTQSQTGLIAGDPDHAVAFAGNAGQGYCTATTPAIGTQDFSWETWIKGAVAGPAVYRSGGPWWLGAAAGVLTLNGATGGALTHQTTMTAGTTYHVVLSRISGVMTLYLNGVASSSTQTDTTNDAATGHEIGAVGGSFTTAVTLDEAALYLGANALNQTKVSAHYAAGTSSPTSFTVSPSTIPANHSGNFNLTLTGTGTNWVAQTFTITNSVTGTTTVTKASQTINSTTSVTLSVHTGSGTGTFTVSDGTLTGPSVTVGTASFTLSPTSGSTSATTGVTATGTNTVWSLETASTLFSLSGITGATLGSIVVSSNTSATFNVVAGTTAATGTVTDNPTGDTASFTTVAGPQTIPVTNANIFFSPGNWYSDGGGSYQANNVKGSSTFARSNNPGAYLVFAVTSAGSGSIKLNLDTTPLNGLTAGQTPRICYNTNGSVLSDQQVLPYDATTPHQVTIQSSLPAGTYQIQVWFEGVDIAGVGDRWTTLTAGASVVKVTGIEIDAASTMAAPTLRSKRAIVFGDSIPEGCDAVGASNGPGDQDATQTFAQHLAAALDCEVGVIGFASQGYTATGTGNVPVFASSYNLYSAGFSRPSGAFAVDYVFVAMGTNDGSGISGNVSGMLTSLRTAAPSAKLVQVMPFGQLNASAITTGFTTYHAGDSSSYLADPGLDYTAVGGAAHGAGRFFTNDGIHPNVRGHAAYAASLAQKLQAALTPGGGSAGFSPIGCGFIRGV